MTPKDKLLGRTPPSAEPPLEEPDELQAPGPEEGMDDGEPKAGKAIQGRYNTSPVGDIQLAKKKGTYNSYTLTLSMGQLEVILNALENNHEDPVSDELLATFQYYLKELPGPGEDEEKFEAKKKADAERAAGKGGLEGEEEELPIPMPPGGQAGTPPETGEEKLFPPEEEEEEEEPLGPGGESGPGEPGARGEPGLPEPEAAPEPGDAEMEPAAETDRRLPKPPRE